MFGGTYFSRALFRQCLAVCLIVVFVTEYVEPLRSLFVPYISEAAEVTIDADASGVDTSHLQSGSQTVFTDDQTGYKFFREAAGNCVYRKTTDGGDTWGTPVSVDAQTDCLQVQVWYDKWTPGIAVASSSIHIVTADTGNDDIWYNRLDTSNDNLLLGSAPVSMITNSAQTGSLSAGENYVSITRGTDGTLYAVSNDGSNPTADSYIVECTSSCQNATGWTETGTNPLDAASDFNILMPLASGNIMIINRDISADDIRFKIWNNASWSGTWTAIDANATENATYDVGMAVTVSSTTPGVLYMAYLANNATLGTDDEVRAARYNGTSWSTVTSPLTGTTRGLTNVAIAIDSADNDVYVAYTGRTTAGTANTGNVYWKRATSSMMSWGAESSAINSTSDDFHGLDLNIASDQRIYASWFDTTDDDIYGDTLVDVFPGIHASSSGSQTASVFASSTVHIGGAFVIYNTYKSYNVTGVTITESGTINGATNISNVQLHYETDTVYPYNCQSVSYDGTEPLFGSIDTNGFSGADGTSAFSGTTVSIGTSTALCLYPVMTVLDNTLANATIDISINNPPTDISVTNGTAGPSTAENIPGTTLVNNDMTTQTHFHFRFDDGNELTATSRTGGAEDINLPALAQGSTTRLRMDVSNEGSSSTPSMQYRLEYGLSSGSCSAISTWIDVGAVGGAFDMYDSSNLTDGSDTTNIPVADGGLSNENTSFHGTNGGVKDTSSTVSGLVLSSTEYVELEYSMIASTTISEGNVYCFRLTNQGTPLFTYTDYPELTIGTDVRLLARSDSQITPTWVNAQNVYLGSAFVIQEQSGTRNVNSITVTETGTVNASTGLDDIQLFYDQDASAPYNCEDQTYAITDEQYGSTDTDGFSGANGSSTFSEAVSVSPTSALCLYVVVDITSTALNGETINLTVTAPKSDLSVSGGGSIGPTGVIDLNSSSSIQAHILTQNHYHWRKDNGSETTASSYTRGLEDTPATYVSRPTPLRLRVAVSNEGASSSPSAPFTLEYGEKFVTCNIVPSWTDVGDAGGAFDMYDSANINDGEDTTNIAVSAGGVSDENPSFLVDNNAQKDVSSSVASTPLSTTGFIETEFSIKQTVDAAYATTFCFRVTQNGVPLTTYTVYPELTTSPERDFEIQRGVANITGTTLTLTAGVDYVQPSASTSAFMRITNTHHTGAGSTVTGTQSADDVTAYLLNPSNIMNSVTIARPDSATGNTQVWWEIIEFTGEVGSDNEIRVRSQTTVTYGSSDITATGTTVSGITDDADVVVFITGQINPDTGTSLYHTGQSTSMWGSVDNVPVFTRGDAGGVTSGVSYAVVEFTGPNWEIQRSEHTYSSAGVTETEPITAVNSLSRTFVHTQKRVGAGLTGIDEFGHEVWLSSIGFVSYQLESGAGSPGSQVSVAWVIENTQTTVGAMDVTRTNGNSTGGSEPLTLSVSNDITLVDLTNASIFVNSRSSATDESYPRPIAGVTIASSTHYELWKSDTGATLTFRTEIVEWPTADLSLRQNYYAFYVDNDALDPTDPWPAGVPNIGENTILSETDEPLGDSERIRLRMSLLVANATFPTTTKTFKLQYAPLTTTCSAITDANWVTLGDSASTTQWRGYNAIGTTDGTVLSTNPPIGGDLNLSVSDVAGTLEEINNSSANPYSVQDGQDVEYDWILEQNGASADTYYCFRMIESDGTKLKTYINYPQLKTAQFTARSQNWRWYDDENSATPAVDLEDENVAPVDIETGQTIVLRITAKEIENTARDDMRFKLQYSEYANFSTVNDVTATSSCVATTTWCYAEGAGTDNSTIPSATLSDADSCSGGVGDGCGSYNESPVLRTGHRHENSAAAEYSFTIKSSAPRVNSVYYFRLYDLLKDSPVEANTAESYPSLVTEGASLTFSISGVPISTLVENVTTDIATTPTAISYGTLSLNADTEAAQRLQITTNAPEGYQIYMMSGSDLISSGGDTIAPISGTNGAPVGWNSGCTGPSTGCFGYHAGDDTLEGGSTRFAASDTYARFSTTTLDEVVYNSGPVTNDTVDMVYRIKAQALQEAGEYTTNVRYIAVPVF